MSVLEDLIYEQHSRHRDLEAVRAELPVLELPAEAFGEDGHQLPGPVLQKDHPEAFALVVAHDEAMTLWRERVVEADQAHEKASRKLNDYAKSRFIVIRAGWIKDRREALEAWRIAFKAAKDAGLPEPAPFEFEELQDRIASRSVEAQLGREKAIARREAEDAEAALAAQAMVQDPKEEADGARPEDPA